MWKKKCDKLQKDQTAMLQMNSNLKDDNKDLMIQIDKYIKRVKQLENQIDRDRETQKQTEQQVHDREGEKRCIQDQLNDQKEENRKLSKRTVEMQVSQE